jgi:hypothetical protein
LLQISNEFYKRNAIMQNVQCNRIRDSFAQQQDAVPIALVAPGAPGAKLEKPANRETGKVPLTAGNKKMSFRPPFVLQYLRECTSQAKM